MIYAHEIEGRIKVYKRHQKRMKFYVFRSCERGYKRAIWGRIVAESITSRKARNMLKNLDIHVGDNYIF